MTFGATEWPPPAKSAFYQDAAQHLPGLRGHRLRYDSPALASGQTALAHDATRALFWAATRGDRPQSRASTWVNLRNVKIEGMATGTIDFTGAPLYGDRTGHSIVLKKVSRAHDGTSETRVLCKRTGGDTKRLTRQECRIR